LVELGGSTWSINVLRVVGIDRKSFPDCLWPGNRSDGALMYNLDDVRLLFENDVRFLEQFD
jgi:hypothetical protein